MIYIYTLSNSEKASPAHSTKSAGDGAGNAFAIIVPQKTALVKENVRYSIQKKGPNFFDPLVSLQHFRCMLFQIHHKS